MESFYAGFTVQVYTGRPVVRHLLPEEVPVEDILDGPGEDFVLQVAKVELAELPVIFHHGSPVAKHGLPPFRLHLGLPLGLCCIAAVTHGGAALLASRTLDELRLARRKNHGRGRMCIASALSPQSVQRV